MRSLRLLAVVCLLVSMVSLPMFGQSGGVTGTVYDKTGAVVPKASVELKDPGTNATFTATSSDVGQFTMVNVPSGTYKLTVTAAGFRKYVVGDLKVDVGKTATINPVLEVGTVSQVVEVQAGAGTELQTTDASMGNVMEKKMLENIPTLSRDATSLLLIQPMATPGFNQNPMAGANGEGDQTGGQVAGARSDQNTFMVDGGDATDSTAGSGQYAGTNFTATPRAVIPTPIESLEEFRVVTNNPSASFGRSEGGVVEMQTRKGTNAWHGAGYWFFNRDSMNANTWTRNENGANCIAAGVLTTAQCDAIAKNRPLSDDRYGGRFGGPIWKDRTFFFLHYEGRQFSQNVDINRLVPSAAMKAGILHFAIGGVIQQFNLNPVPTVDPGVCNPKNLPLGFVPGALAPTATDQTGLAPLDPRNLGLNPTVAGVWAFEPTGTNCFRGDGLNTIGFDATAPFKISEQFGVARFDHKISQNWQATASFRYATTSAPSTAQMDIGGILPGHTKGSPVLTSQRPLQPRYLVFGLSGSITSHMTSDFHFDYLRHFWQWGTTKPFPQVATTTQALAIGGTGVTTTLVPVNFDVQNARSRQWNGKDYNFSENLSWVKGSHLVTWGGRAESQRFFHVRDDKVLGNLATPVLAVGRVDTGINIPLNFRPIGLSGSDLSRYRTYYSSVLGMVDNGGQLLVRDPSLTPTAPGTPLHQHTVVDSYSLYVADTWKIKPSITVTYGLNWTVQMPPYEQTGLNTMAVDASTGKIVTSDNYIAQRKAAALAGTIYNPTFDFVPIKATGRKYPYDVDWSNFGPRVGIAWNPRYSNGWLGSLFGDGKTVVRTGYARIYDRINGVGIVMIPALGIGFGNSVQCRAPNMVGGVCGTPSGFVTPVNGFRIGTDGNSIPIPSLAAISNGKITPSANPCPPPPAVQPPGCTGNSPFEQLDFRIDPKRKVGYSDGVDFSVQRELPGNMLLEVGYVGRYSKKLYQGIGLTGVPYMTTLQGQTFAQGFTAIRKYLMANPAQQSAASPVIPNGLAPVFDGLLGGAASAFCTGFNNCATAAVNSSGAGAFVNANVWDVWDSFAGSVPASVSATGGMGLDSNQIVDPYWIGSNGHSNYNAGFISLRSRGYRGMTFDFNYTYSHAFDQIGQNQESLNESSDSFNLNRDYGSANFDRRHTVNMLVTYDLPFGKGKKYSSGNSFVNHVIGGWNLSTVYVYGSGIPDATAGSYGFYNGNSCEELGASIYFDPCSAYYPIGSPKFITASPSNKNKTSFANPSAVISNYTQFDANGNMIASGVPDFAQGRTGRGFLRSYGRWNMDFGVSKLTKITERVAVRFDMQMTNMFNHPMFSSAQGGPDINGDLSSGTFGAIAAQYNAPRFIQFGFKVEF